VSVLKRKLYSQFGRHWKIVIITSDLKFCFNAAQMIPTAGSFNRAAAVKIPISVTKRVFYPGFTANAIVIPTSNQHPCSARTSPYIPVAISQGWDTYQTWWTYISFAVADGTLSHNKFNAVCTDRTRHFYSFSNVDWIT
jgi:hypothetical protein